MATTYVNNPNTSYVNEGYSNESESLDISSPAGPDLKNPETVKALLEPHNCKIIKFLGGGAFGSGTFLFFVFIFHFIFFSRSVESGISK